MVHEVPSWITVAHGSHPILMLAPHGGRRHDVRVPGKHKVNDLLTAELTHELASMCGASVVVNASLDRNHLDLNRLSQVRRDAPWLIELLADMLGGMVEKFGHATVLVLHGWNVAQIVCDVGIGMRELPEGVVAVRPDSATASAGFIASRIRPLQRAAAEAEIAVTIGSRYPAAHPNNLLQIFRGTRDDPEGEACPIAALCGRAPVEAAQLELGIPLRWPGVRRDRFLALLAAVFDGDGVRQGTPTAPRSMHVPWRVANGRVTHRRGVQFNADDVLVMTSIDAGEHGPMGGRLIVNADHESLALFTGELVDPSAEWSVPPLAIETSPDGVMRVTYDGPLVRYPSLTPFLDLEHGLAGSTLVEAHVDLAVTEDGRHGGEADERFGTVRGRMRIADRLYVIAAPGVLMDGLIAKPPPLPSCRVTLPSSPWGALTLRADPEAESTWQDGRLVGRLVGLAGAGRVVIQAQCDVRMSADTGTLTLEIGVADGPAATLTGALDRLIPVRRPGREGTVVETTFGLVRFDDGSSGWAEITLVKEIPAARS